MSVLDGIVNFGRSKYDRILALAVFLGLLGSLLYLAMRVSSIQEEDAAFQSRRKGLKEAFPEAEAMDPTPFERAAAMVRKPIQIPVWTNAMTVPELRVWCPDCRRPIRWDALVCPFCKAPQKIVNEETRDTDGDGIPDLAEVRLGLDPRNPADAGQDADGDLFTNRDEYLRGTDIRNKNDYPEIEEFIDVAGVDPIAFQLLLKTYMKSKDDTFVFQLNTRKNERTHFKRLGESAEGFKLLEFNQKIIPSATIVGGKDDQSELVLDKGGRKITLVLGLDRQYEEYTVHFVLRLNGAKYACKPGETLNLRPGRSYTLMRIDTATKTAVIRRSGDGKEFTVGAAAPVRGGAAKSAPEETVPAVSETMRNIRENR